MAETKHTPSPAATVDGVSLACGVHGPIQCRGATCVCPALASPASATPAVQQSELELKGPADFDHLTPLSWDADYRDLWLRWQAAEANKMIYRRAWLSVAPAARPRFAKTYCSQCGASLGPGNEGASSCCDHGACPIKARGEDDCPTCNPIATPAKLDLLEAAQAYRDAQDALDNREYAGINAEPHEVLMRRRNAARDDLDAAISSSPANQASAPAAPAGEPQTTAHIKALATLDMFLANNEGGTFEVHAPDGDYLPVSAETLRALLSVHPAASRETPRIAAHSAAAELREVRAALASPTAGTPAAAGLSEQQQTEEPRNGL